MVPWGEKKRGVFFAEWGEGGSGESRPGGCQEGEERGEKLSLICFGRRSRKEKGEVCPVFYRKVVTKKGRKEGRKKRGKGPGRLEYAPARPEKKKEGGKQKRRVSPRSEKAFCKKKKKSARSWPQCRRGGSYLGTPSGGGGKRRIPVTGL